MILWQKQLAQRHQMKPIRVKVLRLTLAALAVIATGAAITRLAQLLVGDYYAQDLQDRLMSAVGGGDLDEARYVIVLGAKVNEGDSYDEKARPLDTAIVTGRACMVKLLRDLRNDPFQADNLCLQLFHPSRRLLDHVPFQPQETVLLEALLPLVKPRRSNAVLAANLTDDLSAGPHLVDDPELLLRSSVS